LSKIKRYDSIDRTNKFHRVMHTKRRISIFVKMNLFICFILVCILASYAYSNRISETTLKREIQNYNAVNSAFLLSQVDMQIDHLSNYAISLGRDTDILRFGNQGDQLGRYESIELNNTIRQKIILFSITGKWNNEVTVISPSARQLISTTSQYGSFPSLEDKKIWRNWHFEPEPLPQTELPPTANTRAQSGSGYFTKDIVDPVSSVASPERARLIIEIRFPVENILKMLEQSTSTVNGGGSFLYEQDDGSAIHNLSKDDTMHKLIPHLQQNLKDDSGSFTAPLEGKQYWIHYAYSKTLGWYLIDYLPASDILAPIDNSRMWFMITVLFILISGIFAAFVLYRNVQMPIKELIHGVQRIKFGDYSIRLRKTHDEFGFLFNRFNDMAEQIEQLVVNVLKEKLHTNEAVLKQLQAQINPHFLYNCLYFIKNKASIGDTEAIKAMALDLGDYYRYSTKMDSSETTVKDEIGLIEKYLNIQNMRSNRLKYTLQIPDSLYELQIPRLLLQPVIENAVEHGIESGSGTGEIHVCGEIDKGTVRFMVDDNGSGLTEQQQNELMTSFNLPESTQSVGLWNVYQRLKHKFGKSADLKLENSQLGGLRVIIQWTIRAEAESPRHEA